MTLEIVFIFILILANGLFAMSEIAVVSARKTRLQQLVNEGQWKAQAVLDLASQPGKFLSTVQVGITLVGIMAGAVGGATLAKGLAESLMKIKIPLNYAEPLAFGVVVLLITFFTIILGELIPKQLALTNPEKVASAVTLPMRFIAKIAYPAVAVLSYTSDGFMRLFGLHPAREQLVDEEEIKVMIDQGIEAGMFEEAERDMIESVFTLGDTRAGQLMTPRTDVVWLDVDDPPEVIFQKINESDHSRFPVCQDSLDTVLGLARAKDILRFVISGESFDIRRWMQHPLFVPENAPALKVLETFKKSRQHVAIVVDEYGVMQGFITVYDILEAIVGDIPSIDEMDEPMAIQRQDGSWLFDGLIALDEFKEIFNIRELPQEGNYQTLGGFILSHLGFIPSAADFFEYSGLRFEVVDMDGTRVDKVLVTPIKKTEPLIKEG
ncbi:HlyC/CorC family transporter [candidate division KSB1 bacterium]|nr:HlyC/CorC family transporter [candidate division KSB1 bacterium]